MSFDSMAAWCSDFPDPTRQAQVVLEIFEEDIQVARSFVWARLRSARSVDEIHYWCQVERLISKRASGFNLNAPSDEEAER